MASRRVERVQEAIREIASELVTRELKDPRIGFLTITGVEASADLRHARVFYTALGDAAAERRAAQALRHALGFIRGEVGRRLGLRYSPELVFAVDTGLRMALEVNRLIAEVHRETPSAGGEASTTGGAATEDEPPPEDT